MTELKTKISSMRSAKKSQKTKTERPGFVKRFGKWIMAGILAVTFIKIGITEPKKTTSQNGSSQPQAALADQDRGELVRVPAKVTKYGCPPIQSIKVVHDDDVQYESKAKEVHEEVPLKKVERRNVTKYACPPATPRIRVDR